jgi:hypothetical protein
MLMSSSLAATIINDFYGDSSGGVYIPNDASDDSSPTGGLQFSVDLINGSKNAKIKVDEASIERISKPAQLGGGVALLTFEGFAREGESNKPIQWWTA